MGISLKNFDDGAYEVWYGETKIGGLRKENGIYYFYMPPHKEPFRIDAHIGRTLSECISLYETGKRIEET